MKNIINTNQLFYFLQYKEDQINYRTVLMDQNIINRIRKFDRIFPSSKRALSMVPQLRSQQSKQTKNSINDKQIIFTRKYLSYQNKQQELDQTQKFILNTKQRLNQSNKQLNEFYKKRLLYKSIKQNIDYQILTEEIKVTKQKLKNKHFFAVKNNKQTKSKYQFLKFNNSTTIKDKKLNNEDKNKKIKNQSNKQSQVFIDGIDSQSFNKVSQGHSQKLKLIEDMLSKQQMTKFNIALQQKLRKINQQYKQKPQLRSKLTKYYQNYQIMSRFLQQLAKDTHKLQVKKQYIQTYYQIKQEMISLLSNQQFFTEHIKHIQQSQQNRQKALLTKTLYQQQRFTKTYSKGKYSNYSGEKNLTQKIQQLLQTSKNSIKEAFNNFNKPYLMYQIQLQFNKRFQDSVINGLSPQ